MIGADADRYMNGGGSSNRSSPTRFTTPRRASPPARARAWTCASTPARIPAAAPRRPAGADAAVVVVADAAGEGVDKPCLRLDCGRRTAIAATG